MKINTLTDITRLLKTLNFKSATNYSNVDYDLVFPFILRSTWQPLIPRDSRNDDCM